jgi:post-segregation antitoxin (ccd killing protein)
MKNFTLIACLSAAIVSGHSVAVTVPSEKVNEARIHAKALGGALKATLKQAIQTNGLEEGIHACRLSAGPIAQGLSINGWQVGRTALKVRNSDNAADAWEHEQLNAFAQALASNVQGPLEAIQYNENTGQMRYMSAIQTGQVCTACHGNAISPSVQQAINAAYPDDQATGFDVGSLRGAFTLTYSPYSAKE